MPRGDGTGPAGFAPMTGRRAGFCAGYDAPGYMNPAPGRGLGRGMRYGYGRGWRAGWAPRYGWGPQYGPARVGNVGTEGEADFLRQQAKFLEQELEEVKRRLAEIEKDDE